MDEVDKWANGQMSTSVHLKGVGETAKAAIGNQKSRQWAGENFAGPTPRPFSPPGMAISHASFSYAT